MGISLGGIIAGGMGGAAAAVGDITKGYIDTEQRGVLAKQAQDAELAKAKAIEDYRIQSGNANRKQLAGELDSTVDRLTREEQARRLTAFDAKHGDGTVTRTPDNLSPEARADTPLDDADQARILQKAGLVTGQMDVKDAAANSMRTAALEGQSNRLTQRLDSQESMNQARIDERAREADAKLEHAMQQVKTGSTQDRLTTIVNSSNATLKSLTEAGAPRTPQGKAEWERQVSDAKELRDIANAQLRARLKGETAPPGYTGPSTSPRPSSGSARKDVSSALDAWNKAR